MLFCRGRDPRRPDRIDIYRKKSSPDDIGICRSRLFISEPHLYPVRPPGKQGRVYLVEGKVYPLDIRKRVEEFYLPDEGIIIIEVAGGDCILPDTPDLNDLTGREDPIAELFQFTRHGTSPGICSPPGSGFFRKPGIRCSSGQFVISESGYLAGWDYYWCYGTENDPGMSMISLLKVKPSRSDENRSNCFPFFITSLHPGIPASPGLKSEKKRLIGILSSSGSDDGSGC